jgi:hypothetical protein
MSYASVSYDAPGSPYSIPFEYLLEANIAVSVNGLPYAGVVTFTAPNTIVLTPDAPSGSIVEITRVTSAVAPVATFHGGPLASADLNSNALQAILLIQELLDSVSAIAIQSGGSGGIPAITVGAIPIGPSSDATAAILASNAVAGRITLQAGVTHVLTPITITNVLDPNPGAILKPAAGVAITLAGGMIDQGDRQVFDESAGGYVVFASGVQEFCRPEWWDNTNRQSCLTAILAAEYSGCPEVRFMSANYFIPNTWNRLVAPLHVQGNNATGAAGSRIIVTGGVADCIVMGPYTAPAGGINSFPQYMTMDGIHMGRTAEPVAASVVTSNGCGLRALYLLYARVTNCRMDEHCIPLNIRGCVSSYFDDNNGTLTATPTGGGTPVFYGVYLDGVTLPLVEAGGNASIYLSRNNFAANAGLGLVQDCSVFANGAFVDTFIDKVESNAKVLVSGVGNGAPASQAGNSNLVIDNLIVDQFADYAVYITNVGDYGSVHIRRFDAAPASGALAAVHIDTSTGLIDMPIGIVQNWTYPMCYGLYLNASNNVRAAFDIMGSAKPVALVNSSNNDISCRVRNNAEAGAEAAYYLAGSSRNFLKPRVGGMAAAFPQGVSADATSYNNDINVTGIDPACLTGGASAKAYINGAYVTTASQVNGNVLSGNFTG